MNLLDVISSLKPASAFVIGDFMLDVYTKGQVVRISPEAPVPVLCVDEENHLPGGAGNAILNMVSLGIHVKACGRVGEDLPGRQFVDNLKKENVDCKGLLVDPSFITPVKKRMIADYQQLLRVDYEKPNLLNHDLENQILESLPSLMRDVQVVAISDYAKGFLTDKILKRVMALSAEAKIPVVVDPKGKDFKKYDGATVIKPNLGEAYAAAGMDRGASLDQVAKKILQDINVQNLMITRSRDGITLYNQSGRKDHPAFIHDVKDVTGAGDTVLAVIALSQASGIDLNMGATLANVAAGIAIERIGCARISLRELIDRLNELQKKDYKLNSFV